MKNSYILRATNGRVVLLREIMDQLNLAETTVLYAVVSREHSDSSGLIVSPLPLSSWANAYRLIVYVGSPPGSLARVTQVLADPYHINLLSAWSAAISASGEGCFTAVVEIPPDQLRSERAEKQLARQIENVLGKALSNSPLFAGDSPLAKVRIVKLKVLAKLFDLFGHEGHFILPVENCMIDLRSLRTPNGEKFAFFERATKRQDSDYVVLTPDTEERYFRLGVLARTDYRHLSVPLKLTGDPKDFTGYFTQVLTALGEKQINVISARNHLISKRLDERAGAAPVGEEQARFSFTLDLSHTNIPTDNADAREVLATSIKQSLVELSRTKGIDLEAREDDILLEPLNTIAPLVFVATNAKPELAPQYVLMAKQLLRLLKAKGLSPVNVEIITRSVLRKEIEDLLVLCPIVISLYLPEEGSRLAHASAGSSENGGGTAYAPSDYTMYEEAYAQATAGCVMVRLRHRSVYRPRFVDADTEIAFDDASFGVALRRIETWLEKILVDPEYRRFARQCDQRKLSATLTPSGNFSDRDLEGWLDGPTATT